MQVQQIGGLVNRLLVRLPARLHDPMVYGIVDRISVGILACPTVGVYVGLVDELQGGNVGGLVDGVLVGLVVGPSVSLVGTWCNTACLTARRAADGLGARGVWQWVAG
jgi:hypothetical protein